MKPPVWADGSERLKEALSRKGGGVTAPILARALNIPEGTMRAYANGWRRPGELVAQKIAAALGVSAKWLRDGEGPMLPEPEPPVDYLAIPLRGDAETLQYAIEALIRLLDPEGKLSAEAVRAIASTVRLASDARPAPYPGLDLAQTVHNLVMWGIAKYLPLKG